MQNNQPYRHPAIECVIRHIFFHGSSAATYDGIYHSSIAELDEPEVPTPMVALTATAVSARLTSRWAGLNHDRCTPLLTTGALTVVRFQQASTRTATAAMLQRLKASRPPTSAHSTQSPDPSIATVCEYFCLPQRHVSIRSRPTNSDRRKSGVQLTVQPLALNMAELSTSLD